MGPSSATTTSPPYIRPRSLRGARQNDWATGGNRCSGTQGDRPQGSSHHPGTEPKGQEIRAGATIDRGAPLLPSVCRHVCCTRVAVVFITFCLWSCILRCLAPMLALPRCAAASSSTLHLCLSFPDVQLHPLLLCTHARPSRMCVQRCATRCRENSQRHAVKRVAPHPPSLPYPTCFF